jgi:hypothetical protein
MHHGLCFFKEIGESHSRVAAGIKKNAMIIRENFGNLVHLIIREKSCTIQVKCSPHIAVGSYTIIEIILLMRIAVSNLVVRV